MTVPNMPGKHAFGAIVEPRDMIAHRRKGGRLPRIDPPSAAIICLQRGLPERLRWRIPIKRVGRLMGDLYAVRRTRGRVIVLANFGLGAPIVAAQAEELIALGASRIVSIALSGGLQPGLVPGTIVVPSAAIRDEGTSHHYLPAAATIGPDTELAAALVTALERKGGSPRTGCIWSTDAPYRETREEVAQLQADGVLAVDMELAALLAVAQVRGVRAAGILVVGDSLADGTWTPPARLDAMERALELAYRTAIEVLDAG